MMANHQLLMKKKTRENILHHYIECQRWFFSPLLSYSVQLYGEMQTNISGLSGWWEYRVKWKIHMHRAITILYSDDQGRLTPVFFWTLAREDTKLENFKLNFLSIEFITIQSESEEAFLDVCRLEKFTLDLFSLSARFILEYLFTLVYHKILNRPWKSRLDSLEFRIFFSEFQENVKFVASFSCSFE